MVTRDAAVAMLHDPQFNAARLLHVALEDEGRVVLQFVGDDGVAGREIQCQVDGLRRSA
jgi:hypothetical protein